MVTKRSWRVAIRRVSTGYVEVEAPSEHVAAVIVEDMTEEDSGRVDWRDDEWAVEGVPHQVSGPPPTPLVLRLFGGGELSKDLVRGWSRLDGAPQGQDGEWWTDGSAAAFLSEPLTDDQIECQPEAPRGWSWERAQPLLTGWAEGSRSLRVWSELRDGHGYETAVVNGDCLRIAKRYLPLLQRPGIEVKECEGLDGLLAFYNGTLVAVVMAERFRDQHRDAQEV